MNARHWTGDDLVNHLYGVGPDDAHLETCADCRARWSELREKRASLMQDEEPSNEFLAAQRRKVYQRMGQPSHPVLRWIPAFVALAMLVIGLFLFTRGRGPVESIDPQVAAGADAQLSEIYAMEETSQSKAAKPLEALFEAN